jgi:hypothetical protein
MNNALSVSNEPFLLVTLDGFALRRREPRSGEYLDARLGEKPAILLSFLALVQAAVPRAHLCDLLWSDADGSRARNSLRQAIFRIRRALGQSAVIETEQGVVLRPGIVAIDLETVLRNVAPEHAEEVRERLAASFGITSRPIGRAFSDWCLRVRREVARGGHQSLFLGGVASQAPEAAVPLLRMAGVEDATSHRLSQLFRLSLQGIPLVVWAMGRPETEVRSVVDSFAAACGAQGARVAAVPRRPGAGYARFALERELAEVLWPLPGAAGIKPAFHEALVRLQRGLAVESTLLRDAMVDLMSAVAENGPLVLTVGDPGRYSLGALTSLISELTTLRDRPILLVVAEHSGVRPVHTHCIEVPVGGMRRAAAESEERLLSV